MKADPKYVSETIYCWGVKSPRAKLELEREMEYFVEPEEAFTRDEIE